MKLIRIALPVLLFLIAVPSFALCSYCDFNCNCVTQQGSESRCKPTVDCCYDIPASCLMATTPAPMLFASNFTIASVEVITPAKHVVTTAEPRLAERTSRPDPHTR
jgi:hypothetical protein